MGESWNEKIELDDSLRPASIQLRIPSAVCPTASTFGQARPRSASGLAADDADWRVSTRKDDDRQLQVYGWSHWEDDQLSKLDLHVNSRRALLITERWLADTLLTIEQPHVLATMVACAEEIALRLHTVGVGNGCLEWQLDPRDVEYVQRLFADFQPRKRPLRRGKRYLRKRLTDA